MKKYLTQYFFKTLLEKGFPKQLLNKLKLLLAVDASIKILMTPVNPDNNTNL